MRVKRVANSDGSHYGVHFHCPGCDEEHVIPTQPHASGWVWNGDYERPTITPSVLVYENPPNPETGWPGTPRCHSVITDGRIAFAPDTTHALSGQVVDLPELLG